MIESELRTVGDGLHPVPNRDTKESGAGVVLPFPAAKPDRRTRKSMSRRSGQNGYIEKRGNAYYVRFRIDVAGQEKRQNACVRICPVSGPGRMTKPERERRAKEIIAESGADTEKHFRTVEAVNLASRSSGKPNGLWNTYRNESADQLSQQRNKVGTTASKSGSIPT